MNIYFQERHMQIYIYNLFSTNIHVFGLVIHTVAKFNILKMLSIGNCESKAVLQWSCNAYDCIVYIIIQSVLCYIYMQMLK